jgi:hypothetical protein
MLEREGPVVAAIVILAAAALFLPPTEPNLLVPTEAPEPLLLAAYERSRTVEALVVSTFTRTVADGRQLTYDQRLVQRPPDDRLVIGAGVATGRVGGRVVRCRADDEGEPSCTQGAEAEPYADEVAAEVRALASLVDPDTGAYDVEALDGGCFVLELDAAVLSPPYGTAATFCFDAATGVLSTVEVVRPEATDRTEAVQIRTAVDDADLRAADLGDAIATG